MNPAENRLCEPKAVSLFCRPVLFLFLEQNTIFRFPLCPALRVIGNQRDVRRHKYGVTEGSVECYTGQAPAGV